MSTPSGPDQPFTVAYGRMNEQERFDEMRRRLRAALTEHVADMTEADARALLVDVAEALDSLRGSYAGDPRDWGEYRRDAWTYGVVLGWGEEAAEDGLPLVEHIGNRHGWSAENVARLRRYAGAVERLEEHGRHLWPELRERAQPEADTRTQRQREYDEANKDGRLGPPRPPKPPKDREWDGS